MGQSVGGGGGGSGSFGSFTPPPPQPRAQPLHAILQQQQPQQQQQRQQPVLSKPPVPATLVRLGITSETTLPMIESTLAALNRDELQLSREARRAVDPSDKAAKNALCDRKQEEADACGLYLHGLTEYYEAQAADAGSSAAALPPPATLTYFI